MVGAGRESTKYRQQSRVEGTRELSKSQETVQGRSRQSSRQSKI